jgi:hypothetical protein
MQSPQSSTTAIQRGPSVVTFRDRPPTQLAFTTVGEIIGGRSPEASFVQTEISAFHRLAGMRGLALLARTGSLHNAIGACRRGRCAERVAGHQRRAHYRLLTQRRVSLAHLPRWSAGENATLPTGRTRLSHEQLHHAGRRSALRMEHGSAERLSVRRRGSE